MRKSEKRKEQGITLVALVVTIIILLILAGVAINMVVGDNGLLKSSQNATAKNKEAKARETLYLTLQEAKIRKYGEGLTEEQLTVMIKKIGEEVPKEDPESNNQKVIVDGYIFEIDRIELIIINNIGLYDGVKITAELNNNTDEWISADESEINITGTITTNSGGKIKTVKVTRDGIEIEGISIDKDGKYIIDNITDSGTYEIYAEDNKGRNNSKEIQVNVKVDKTALILSRPSATAEYMKIKISVEAEDNESTLQSINYSVTPSKTISPSSGKLISGQEVELTASIETEYTVTFTATDKVGNTSKEITAKATTMYETLPNELSIEQVKQSVTSRKALQRYMGIKVSDYEPTEKGTWRIFYYDQEGDFGDKGRIYLKRDYITSSTVLSSYSSYTPSKEEFERMKRMNPMWKKDSLNFLNEHCAAWLCDSTQWTGYCDTKVAEFAIGSPSIEMYIRAFNIWKKGENYDKTDSATDVPLSCKIGNVYGYDVANDGKSFSHETEISSIATGPNSVFMTPGNYYWWIASPSSYGAAYVCLIYGGYKICPNYQQSGAQDGPCPIACLKP